MHQAGEDACKIAEYCFDAAKPNFQGQLGQFTKQIEQVSSGASQGTSFWDSIDYIPLDANLSAIPPYEPIRFCSRVLELSQSYYPGGLVDEGISIANASLYQQSGHNIECLPIDCSLFYDDMFRSVESAELLEFHGFFALLPVRRQTRWVLEKRFFIAGCNTVNLAAQRLQIQDAENEEAERIINQYSDLLVYLRAEVVAALNIKGIKNHPQLSLSIDAAIYQALAFGTVNGNAGRIHTLVIGAPGVGKKLIAGTAKLLNPTATEAHSAKCTVAGIQSRAKRKEGGFESEPGLIPLADLGVFSIQDFHGVKDKDSILAVLSNVMEDGKVIDSSAAKKEQLARTAIHLDLNRQSDLDPDKTVSSELEDIGMKLHVLSRFDYITEIHRDRARQATVAADMLSGTAMVGQELLGIKNAGTAVDRRLQVLVAILRDRNESVAIDQSITKLIGSELAAMTKQITHPMLSDFLSRQSNSALKFVAASARLHGRNVATKDDFDAIKPLLESKIAFIQSLLPKSASKNPVLDFTNAKERRKWIASEYAGMSIQVDKVVQKLKSAGFSRANIRMIYRDLKKLKAKNESKGTWRIP